MRVRVPSYVWVGGVCFFSLLLNFVVYGALVRVSEVGPLFKISAQREAALTYTYMFVGEYLCAEFPMVDSLGKKLAVSAFSDIFDDVRQNPMLATEILEQPNHRLHRWFNWNRMLTPIFFTVWFFLGLFRSRKVSLMSRKA